MHYSCRSCKRVFFERDESGECSECGAELVPSGTRESSERVTASRQKLVTLMGEDFLADALRRRKESLPPTAGGVPAGVAVGDRGAAASTGQEFLTGALMQAKVPAPLAQTAADLTSAGPAAAEPASASPKTGKLTSAGQLASGSAGARLAAGPAASAVAQTARPASAKMPVTSPRPPAAPGMSRERVFGIAGIIVLGAATGILAVVLLARSPDYAVVADAQARIAELEKRIADFEAGRIALKEENTALSAANRDLGVEKGTLEQRIGDLREDMARQAEARRLALGAVALLERRSNLDRALEMVDAALALGPGLLAAADANRVKGRLLTVAGRPGEALGAFEAAHDAAKKAGEVVGDAEALVLAGEVCLTDLSDRDRALDYYGKAAELEAGSAFGLVADARTFLLGGDWDGAISKAMRARKADPSLSLAPLVLGEAVLGRAMERSGAERDALLKEADPFLVDALRLDPNSAHACFVRGRLLIEQTRLMSPERGFGLARFGRQDEAARLLQKAKDLSPSRPEVYLALGELRLEKGALRNPGLARTFAEQAVELTGRKDAAALATLASALAASGSPAEAAKTMAEALEVGPGNDEMRSLLARYRAEAEATSP
jgi:tetratricopeptide (TPR) repeat protein